LPQILDNRQTDKHHSDDRVLFGDEALKEFVIELDVSRLNKLPLAFAAIGREAFRGGSSPSSTGKRVVVDTTRSMTPDTTTGARYHVLAGVRQVLLFTSGNGRKITRDGYDQLVGIDVFAEGGVDAFHSG